MDNIKTVGRRKESVARIFLKKGTGNIVINSKQLNDYFPLENLRNIVKDPFRALNIGHKHDVQVNVEGGGMKGQAEAIRLGIARALCKESADYRPSLKKEHWLTRDSRAVERKKPGLRKARKSSQFSKR